VDPTRCTGSENFTFSGFIFFDLFVQLAADTLGEVDLCPRAPTAQVVTVWGSNGEYLSIIGLICTWPISWSTDRMVGLPPPGQAASIKVKTNQE
jgi:hypothetical protein